MFLLRIEDLILDLAILQHFPLKKDNHFLYIFLIFMKNQHQYFYILEYYYQHEAF